MPAANWIRPAGAVLGGVAVAAGAYLASGEPRLTLLNTALQFDHPWYRSGAALATAAGATLLAVLAPRGWARIVFGLIALLGLWTALELLRFRVVSGRDGLAVRGPFGESSVAWSQVVSVDREPGVLLIRGDAVMIRLRTGDLRAEDRATLERNVARNLALPAPPAEPAGTPASPPVSKP